MLVGCRTFERLAAGRRGFDEAYEEFTKTFDLSGLSLDPDELLEGVRDSTRGRDIRL